jgi:hypothetical protein
MQVTGSKVPTLHELDFEGWKKEIAARVTQHVQASFRHYYPALASARHLQVVVKRPPVRRRFTVIFEIDIEDQGGSCMKSLIAKAYRITPKLNAQDQDVERKCRREFQFHTQVHEYFSAHADEFSVVRPLDYLPELRTLIVEKAEGTDLGKLTHQARYSVSAYHALKRKLGGYFQRCGKWLALLHEGFASPVPAGFDAQALEQQVNRYYQRLMRAGGPAKTAEAIRQRILALGKAFAGTPVKQSQLHGDFKLRHIFVTERRITPIDFGNELKGATFDDVARLLVEIKLLDYGPKMPAQRSLRRDLQDHFLTGYFGSAAWPPLLRLYYIVWLWAKWDRRLRKFATNKLIKQVDAWMCAIGLKNVINHAYVNRWFQKELNAEIELLEKEIGHEHAVSNLATKNLHSHAVAHHHFDDGHNGMRR